MTVSGTPHASPYTNVIIRSTTQSGRRRRPSGKQRGPLARRHRRSWSRLRNGAAVVVQQLAHVGVRVELEQFARPRSDPVGADVVVVARERFAANGDPV